MISYVTQNTNRHRRLNSRIKICAQNLTYKLVKILFPYLTSDTVPKGD